MSGTVTLYHGDCLEIMRGMADASVDAVVTDPPAGIAFMGRAWDHHKGGRDQWVAWMQEVATECLRVMKPGAHAAVWALPKTAHWTAWAWESAGFGVPREKTYFLFGTGFPKNARVNRDPRFCQCGESERSDESSSLGLPLALHNDTAADVAGSVPPNGDVLHSRNKLLGFPDDCLLDRDFYDAPFPLAGEDGQASVPQPGCAQEHTRSFEREDAQDDGASRIPFQAQYTGLPSSPDSPLPCSALLEGRFDNQESTIRNRKTGLGIELLVSHTGHKASLSLASENNDGWPFACQACGKPDAKGFGTALKPAAEEWLIFRKPLAEPTVAANVLRHGTGALNIDATRVEGEPIRTTHGTALGRMSDDAWDNAKLKGQEFASHPAGRFPPNLLHDGSPEVLAAFARFGERRTGDPTSRGADKTAGLLQSPGSGWATKNAGNRTGFSDTGTAARFFPALGYTEEELRFHYSGKASRKERDAGCEGLPLKKHGGEHFASPRLNDQRMEREQARNPMRNTHPTVKPVALMAWLCRLVTPPGGTILDPFAGSGSTGLAAMAEGFDCILIEREEEYLAIAKARIAAAQKQSAPDPKPSHPDLFAETAA